MTFPINMGNIKKWQPNHQPVICKSNSKVILFFTAPRRKNRWDILPPDWDQRNSYELQPVVHIHNHINHLQKDWNNSGWMMKNSKFEDELTGIHFHGNVVGCDPLSLSPQDDLPFYDEDTATEILRYMMCGNTHPRQLVSPMTCWSLYLRNFLIRGLSKNGPWNERMLIFGLTIKIIKSVFLPQHFQTSPY